MTTLETYMPFIVIAIFVIGHLITIAIAIRNMRKDVFVEEDKECRLHKWTYVVGGMECSRCKFRAGGV